MHLKTFDCSVFFQTFRKVLRFKFDYFLQSVIEVREPEKGSDARLGKCDSCL